MAGNRPPQMKGFGDTSEGQALHSYSPNQERDEKLKAVNFWAKAEEGKEQERDFGEDLLQLPYWENKTRMGWKKQKLESRLPGEISISSDMQMTPPSWQKVKRNSKAS